MGNLALRNLTRSPDQSTLEAGLLEERRIRHWQSSFVKQRSPSLTVKHSASTTTPLTCTVTSLSWKPKSESPTPACLAEGSAAGHTAAGEADRLAELALSLIGDIRSELVKHRDATKVSFIKVLEMQKDLHEVNATVRRPMRI